MLGEFELRAHDGGIGADKGEPLTVSDGWGQRLAVHAGEFRLGVEEVQMAGGPGHEEVDDGFGFSRIVRLSGLHGIEGSGGGGGVGEGAFGEEAGEGDFAKADTAVTEEVAAGEVEAGIGGEAGHGGRGEGLGGLGSQWAGSPLAEQAGSLRGTGWKPVSRGVWLVSF